MKSYIIHRSIRSRATLYGLSIERFAIFMSSVILSLLMIIFSFGFGMVIFMMLWNTLLYIALLRVKAFPTSRIPGQYPDFISCKQLGLASYED
ncbi:hypothetical protein C7S20_19110 [Christiangramia fulva]|uniref:Uncharacterized protein n=1 Tax=Christiangramia fulva TaxID=2126553 RepID=A0A2R3ZA72_9FLAO|nr:hypothetical protein C7S20_19110 [Christiangramia fulva]